MSDQMQANQYVTFSNFHSFLRSTKPYSPSIDVQQKVKAICATLQIPEASSHKLTNLEEKFKFLEACCIDFHHSVPNSQVHELNTVGMSAQEVISSIFINFFFFQLMLLNSIKPQLTPLCPMMH